MNIVFDLGGVILRWEPKALLVENYSDESKREIFQTKFLQNKKLWNDYDKGIVNVDELSAYANSIGLTDNDVTEFLDIVCRHLVPREEVVDIVRYLFNQKKHKLYILSNMGAVPAEYLTSNYDIWKLFDGIIFSCDTGLAKPDRGIYEYLLGKYCLKADETVFIDDLPANVEGAEAVGIKAIHFKTASQVRKELEIVVGSN